MKRKKILSNNKNSNILEFNICSKILFSNKILLGDNMSIEIKGNTAIVNGEVYDLSNPTQEDAEGLMEYARTGSEPKRLPEVLENIIARYPSASIFYAAEVLGRRWPEAEEVIIKRLKDIMGYVTFVEAPWPEAEDIIAQDGNECIEYAYLIKGRFFKGEKTIIDSPYFEEYKRFLISGIYESFKLDHQL